MLFLPNTLFLSLVDSLSTLASRSSSESFETKASQSFNFFSCFSVPRLASWETFYGRFKVNQSDTALPHHALLYPCFLNRQHPHIHAGHRRFLSVILEKKFPTSSTDENAGEDPTRGKSVINGNL